MLLFSVAFAGAVPSGDWQETKARTVFQVNDHEVLAPVNSGRWHLSGDLEIKFAGVIEPHENSVLPLFGPAVEAIQGRFDRVILPAGWQGDLKYNDKAGRVRCDRK